jgi:hypothetical protein
VRDGDDEDRACCRAVGGRAAAPRSAADGHLEISRGPAVEHVRNTDAGVEQSWAFAERPTGEGDLTVRVRVTGCAYARRSEGGLHFADEKTGVGVRYGRATWVDARGKHVSVEGVFADGEIALVVPRESVEGAAYPAVLDPMISPIIGPEFGMDNPVLGPARGDEESPAVASDGTNFLVVWIDSRANPNGNIYAARVSPAGTLLDPTGIDVHRESLREGEPDRVGRERERAVIRVREVDGVQQCRRSLQTAGFRRSPESLILRPRHRQHRQRRRRPHALSLRTDLQHRRRNGGSSCSSNFYRCRWTEGGSRGGD